MPNPQKAAASRPKLLFLFEAFKKAVVRNCSFFIYLCQLPEWSLQKATYFAVKKIRNICAILRWTKTTTTETTVLVSALAVVVLFAIVHSLFIYASCPQKSGRFASVVVLSVQIYLFSSRPKSRKSTERFYFLVPRINWKERKNPIEGISWIWALTKKVVLESLSFAYKFRSCLQLISQEGG